MELKMELKILLTPSQCFGKNSLELKLEPKMEPKIGT